MAAASEGDDSRQGGRVTSSAPQTLNSVVRFGLELAALIVLGVWGWTAVTGQPQQLVLAIAAAHAG